MHRRITARRRRVARRYMTSPELADEVLAASARRPLPSPPHALRARADEYWAAMSRGVALGLNRGLVAAGGAAASAAATSSSDAPSGAPQLFENPRGGTPRVMGYSECAEATGNTFWKGAPYDELARR